MGEVKGNKEWQVERVPSSVPGVLEAACPFSRKLRGRVIDDRKGIASTYRSVGLSQGGLIVLIVESNQNLVALGNWLDFIGQPWLNEG